MSGKKTNTEPGLTDRFGRIHNYLRISITEKCNFQCHYCMPDSKYCSYSDNNITASEIRQIASAFIKLGITKIRLTGGEPLIRNDFPDIVEELGKFNIHKAITTNGYLLDRYMPILKKNNFHTINISLDTLSGLKFKQITGTDKFDKVYNNLFIAVNEGFEVKLNTVLIRGVNDIEILDFAQLTKNLPLTVRFIEFMPFKDNNWDYNKIIGHDEILRTLSNHYLVKPVYLNSVSTPARYYKLGSNIGAIGIISTVTKPFCNNCNRIRITSDGKIKSCLFGLSEINLIDLLRNGRDITSVIKKSLEQKPLRHGDKKLLNLKKTKGSDKHNRGMYAIGG